MSRARRLVAPILIGLIAIVITVALTFSIEFYDHKVEDRWSAQAWRNPFLAAQQFMQRSGINTIEVDNLNQIASLDNVDTLLITDAEQVASPRQLQNILDWLENGGNVITTAASSHSDRNLLLGQFDVHVENYMHTSQDENRGKSTAPISESLREYNRQLESGKTPEEIPADSPNSEHHEVTSVDFGKEIGSIDIAFNQRKVLIHPYIEEGAVEETNTAESENHTPSYWVSSDHGVHLIQFDAGGGRLTILSDADVWHSGRIDEHDHAYFLWLLSGSDGDLTVIHHTAVDSWWKILWESARASILAGAILLILTLWRVSSRFGRVMPDTTPERRSLGEQFTAIAAYLWRKKSSDALLNALRKRILQRASIHINGFALATLDVRLGLLATHSQSDVTQVTAAMSSTVKSESEFLRTVKTLQQIEQTL